ncbi:MAG TPA: hypothetical protein PL009_14020 [Flavipsychrobacter sp.]|nr:hypothetical protein [Flavipsychrobacter sp.]
MRRQASLTLFLAILSVICGYMLSKASWIGRLGMSLFYQQYQFLKVWWKGALLVFAVLIFLYAVQSFVQRRATNSIAKVVHLFALVAALVGLYLTYDDFRNTTSHRWLGERFHIGAYLFWIGWMVISVYMLLTNNNEKPQQKME